MVISRFWNAFCQNIGKKMPVAAVITTVKKHELFKVQMHTSIENSKHKKAITNLEMHLLLL